LQIGVDAALVVRFHRADQASAPEVPGDHGGKQAYDRQKRGERFKHRG
jgi:hypothetical protein